jgi:hypothetical protein
MALPSISVVGLYLNHMANWPRSVHALPVWLGRHWNRDSLWPDYGRFAVLPTALRQVFTKLVTCSLRLASYDLNIHIDGMSLT